MKKLKINQNNSLKRVLSVDEMKSIFGGMGALAECKCTFHYIDIVNGVEIHEKEAGEPFGAFHTPELCDTACNDACSKTPGCDYATVSYFRYEAGSGSGSE